MELSEKNSLKFKTIKLIAKNLFRAISYIHTKNIMHRDIQPANILCSSDGKNLKLIDFGVSRKFSSEKSDQEFENKIIT